MRVQVSGLLAGSFLLLLSSAQARAQECCVCDADCPSPGTRVCFNVQSAPDCAGSCASAGCAIAPVCIPNQPCVDIELCDETGAVRCGDGRDNNANGLIDCQEPSCSGEAGCHPAAPVLAWPASVGLFVALGLGGVWMLRRRGFRDDARKLRS